VPGWVHPAVADALAVAGIRELWSHQVEAAEAARAGRHVVVSTGTASGKTLAYLLPAATAALEGGTDGGVRTAPTTLYLSPTKALAADQERRLAELAVPGLRTGTVDGDATPEQRTWVRDHAHLVLSNPDLLAHTLLPDHVRWSRLLRRLRYVVLDECHVYRGVFGAHVAAVLRRLRRVAASYGASPTFVLCSATVAEPARTASRLTGLAVHAVEHDGSPDPGASLLLWDPVVDEPTTGPAGVPLPVPERARRRGVVAESADLVAELVSNRVRTVAFLPSRRGTETLAGRTRDALVVRHGPDVGGRLAQAVVPYRGGHLPEERRATEGALREGDLLAVATTSALELGVDVAGLDAVVMAGWPGSVASLRQRAGRAGRADLPGTAVLVARDDPLDAYVLAHPEQVLDAPVEAVVSDTDNPYVLLPHLAAASAELPLTEADLPVFGPNARQVVDVLVQRGDLRRRPGGWFWARPDRPRVDLRGSGRGQVQLVEDATGRVLGTVEAARAEQVVHPGAVYQHLLRSYVVLELDLDDGVALLRAGDPGWLTYPRTSTRTRLVSSEEERRLGGGDSSTARWTWCPARPGSSGSTPRPGPPWATRTSTCPSGPSGPGGPGGHRTPTWPRSWWPTRSGRWDPCTPRSTPGWRWCRSWRRATPSTSPARTRSTTPTRAGRCWWCTTPGRAAPGTPSASTRWRRCGPGRLATPSPAARAGPGARPAWCAAAAGQATARWTRPGRCGCSV